MKYKSKKGTVIDIPDGLSPKQIQQIKADADSGYGTRAQQTANKLAKQPAAPQQQTPIEDPGDGPVEGGSGLTPRQQERLAWLKKNRPNDPQVKKLEAMATTGAVSAGLGAAGLTPNPDGQISAGTVSKTGTINPVLAADDVARAEAQDFETNFKTSVPTLQTDASGNTMRVVRDPVTGEVTVSYGEGEAPSAFKNQALAAAQTFGGDVSRRAAEEAAYNTLTRYYDRDMSREMEEAKQELAERGIPYDPAAAMDPNTKNLYGRTVGGISEKFRTLKDTAAQQAILSGNQAYATDAAARDSFINAATQGYNTFGNKFGPYATDARVDTSQDTKDIIALSSDAFLKKYGIDKDTFIKNKALNKPTGGGGGGGGGGQQAGGFEIIG